MTRKEKEFKLWKQWKEDDDEQARDELLRSLAPLLNDKVNKFTKSPIPNNALRTKARNLALKAFETYDPDKAQLNTHVTNHLKHLQRYVLNYQNVGKIPEHRGIAISRFQNTKSFMEDDLQREPNVKELADTLNWSMAEVERMQRELRSDLNLTQKENDDEGGFFDFTFQHTDPLRDSIEFVYFDSNDEEKKILEYTFGFGGEQEHNITEIAKKLRRSPSYVKTRMKRLAREIQNVRMSRS